MYLYFREVFFQIFPIIADVTIAVIFFLSAFDVYIGLTILITMAVYLGKYNTIVHYHMYF